MEIKLSNGMVALVDDGSPLADQGPWHYSDGYAVRNGKRLGGGRITEKLHRLVMGDCPRGMQVDHANGNKLDNRSCNLRLVSTSQNRQNAKKRRDNTSGCKGVHPQNGKWVASIGANGKKLYLGIYADKADAEKAVRSKREELHGQFARHE